MLKKNLVKTCLFGQALLLLIPNATAVKGEPVLHSNAFTTWKPAISRTTTDSLTRPDADSATFNALNASVKETVAPPSIILNKQAEKFVKSYLVREKESLDKVKGRCRSYFKLIDTIFTKYGLPLELKYLAVIESDLTSTARSKVGARGMWQLMPGTARDLGLKVGKKYDERTQVYKSTVAAAKYLRDLYGYYGDWLLVLAAYNGGPGTVDKAIRKAGSRNFWSFQNYLPMESRGHVKRFIATHYYFEGKGSFTTMTKAEVVAYKKAKTKSIQLQEVKSEVIMDSLTAVAVNR